MKAETLFDVKGLAVLVTGAASSIGFAYAEVLAANGAHVTLADKHADALDNAVARLRWAGHHVHGLCADVTQPETLQAAVATLLQRETRLDVLFANAGIGDVKGDMKADSTRHEASAIERHGLESFDAALAGNLRGVLASIQAAVPTMKRQGAGRIIVTTSIPPLQTETPLGALYVASKTALGQLVRQAALELAEYGILVNGIAPGPTLTNIGCGLQPDPQASPPRLPFELVSPLHRPAGPADLHGAALFLASPASAYITGTQIVIDGGASLGRALTS